MNAEQERLLQEPVFRHFTLFVRFRTPASARKRISRYLFDWPASAGLKPIGMRTGTCRSKAPPREYENAPGVMLQAHMTWF